MFINSSLEINTEIWLRRRFQTENNGVPSHQGEFPSSSSTSEDWRRRILIPTILAGVACGGFGLVSKYRKLHGPANISATYATNFAIVTGCYCGAREFVTATHKTGPEDLLNYAIAGFGTGAILGHLHVDFTALKLRYKLPHISESMFDKSGSLKLLEWSPIQVLDEEALAAKLAREEKLYGQRKTLSKEES
ncbi:putative Nam protein 1 [Hibiscus syriacus]|uniref:Nam protein 1 n=1 Tax=Hibiscus syriacus TaxID=106335 RepID=A0A6A3AZ87_HIBSY|nr:putative Nam protein 1 [Hibiscus syriacus]